MSAPERPETDPVVNGTVDDYCMAYFARLDVTDFARLGITDTTTYWNVLEWECQQVSKWMKEEAPLHYYGNCLNANHPWNGIPKFQPNGKLIMGTRLGYPREERSQKSVEDLRTDGLKNTRFSLDDLPPISPNPRAQRALEMTSGVQLNDPGSSSSRNPPEASASQTLVSTIAPLAEEGTSLEKEKDLEEVIGTVEDYCNAYFYKLHIIPSFTEILPPEYYNQVRKWMEEEQLHHLEGGKLYSKQKWNVQTFDIRNLTLMRRLYKERRGEYVTYTVDGLRSIGLENPLTERLPEITDRNPVLQTWICCICKTAVSLGEGRIPLTMCPRKVYKHKHEKSEICLPDCGARKKDRETCSHYTGGGEGCTDPHLATRESIDAARRPIPVNPIEVWDPYRGNP